MEAYAQTGKIYSKEEAERVAEGLGGCAAAYKALSAVFQDIGEVSVRDFGVDENISPQGYGLAIGVNTPEGQPLRDITHDIFAGIHGILPQLPKDMLVYIAQAKTVNYNEVDIGATVQVDPAP